MFCTAVLEGIDVGDLFCSSNETVNTRRVRLWNATKVEMSTEYRDCKKLVRAAFPHHPAEAAYKKCNYCGTVFCKPIDCDFGTACGQPASPSFGSDGDTLAHKARSSMTYAIEKGALNCVPCEDGGGGPFEQGCWKLRTNFKRMVYEGQWAYPNAFFGFDCSMYTSPYAINVGGCGRNVEWTTMVPLNEAELMELELVVSRSASFPSTETHAPAHLQRAVSASNRMQTEEPAAEMEIHSQDPCLRHHVARTNDMRPPSNQQKPQRTELKRKLAVICRELGIERSLGTKTILSRACKELGIPESEGWTIPNKIDHLHAQLV
jgi:hypothetical protein